MLSRSCSIGVLSVTMSGWKFGASAAATGTVPCNAYTTHCHNSTVEDKKGCRPITLALRNRYACKKTVHTTSSVHTKCSGAHGFYIAFWSFWSRFTFLVFTYTDPAVARKCGALLYSQTCTPSNRPQMNMLGHNSKHAAESLSRYYCLSHTNWFELYVKNLEFTCRDIGYGIVMYISFAVSSLQH